MQLVIKNGKVIATHQDYIKLLGKYPEDCEIAYYSGTFKLDPDKENLDPRTEQEKKQAYKYKREMEYPTATDLVVALWEKYVENDPGADQKIQDLQTWRERIKDKYPKPK